jgi:CRP-like cAMP-binding protein
MMSYAHDAVAAARAFFLRLHALGEVTSLQVEEAETRPALPRMTARAVTSFVMTALEPIQRLAGGELTTGLVLAAIASANAELRGPVTALALSERLGLARETTRRHVGRLTTQGLAAATSRGVMAPPAVMEGPRVQGAYERICGRRDTLLQRLTLAGILSRATPCA